MEEKGPVFSFIVCRPVDPDVVRPSVCVSAGQMSNYRGWRTGGIRGLTKITYIYQLFFSVFIDIYTDECQ